MAPSPIVDISSKEEWGERVSNCLLQLFLMMLTGVLCDLRWSPNSDGVEISKVRWNRRKQEGRKSVTRMGDQSRPDAQLLKLLLAQSMLVGVDTIWICNNRCHMYVLYFNCLQHS